jgi:hypothetical protein
MPTSNSEAGTIVKIVKDYLSIEQMTELFTKLDEEVGQKTDNMSLKTSLAMLRTLVKSPVVKFSICWEAAFYALVFIHFVLIGCMAASFILLPFYFSLLVAVPVNVFIFTLLVSREECKLTALENYIRQKTGRKRIGGFVGHYIVKRFKKH